MAVNLTNANAALKTYYLDAVAEHIDTEKVRKYGRA